MIANIYSKGSEWRRWDLHIHTPQTKKNDQFSGDGAEEKWDKYVASIESYSTDIAVLGVTDYFCVDNYFRMKEYLNAGRLGGVKCVIPNVEVRCTPVTGNGRALNLHFLFDPEYDVNIKPRFLDNLQFKGSDRPYTASRTDLIALGRDHSHEPQMSAEAAYKIGLDQYVLPFEAIKELFKSDQDLRRHCLIVVANGSNDGASGVRSHSDFLSEGSPSALNATVRAIYQFSDAVFSSNPKDRKYFLGEKPRFGKQEIIRQYGKLLPCLHGCDAHTYSKIFEPAQQRYCWIKANPGFAGLRQVIFDPSERVHIGELAPTGAPARQRIDHLITENCEDLSGNVISFSPFLNCIIGGRSTGKSILLALLARRLKPNQEAKRDDPGYETLISQLARDCSIVWADGITNDDRHIEYFGQGHIDRYHRDKAAFDELIRGIVTGGLDNDPVSEYDTFVAENRAALYEWFNKLQHLRHQAERKEEEIQAIGDKEGIQKAIEELQVSIADLRRGRAMSETDYNYYQKCQTVLQNNNAEQQLLNKDSTAFEQIGNITLRLPSLDQFSMDQQRVLNDVVTELQREVEESWKLKVAEKKELVAIRQHELSSQLSKIKEDTIFQKGLELKESDQALAELEGKLKTQQVSLADLVRVERELKQNQERIEEVEGKILEQNWLYYTECERLSNQLTSRITNEELKIEAYPNINLIGYNERLQMCINLWSDEHQKAAKFDSQSSGDFKSELADKFRRSLKGEIRLKNQHTPISFLEMILAEPQVAISYQITYDGDTFDHMSEGKKAFVILRLLLDYSNRSCPILIDQPEDELDNRAIYTDLVKYLRQKKKERQIILVTHNPNIVVGTDAEQVIVANQHGVNTPNCDGIKFCYLTGGLEHSVAYDDSIAAVLERQGIREHVCEVLEGGAEAFRNREQRYTNLR